ncbi:MATE domain protein, partial [Hungatella hathewayi DSM 13479]
MARWRNKRKKIGIQDGLQKVKAENNLDSDDMRGLVWRLAFPSMLAQFVSVFYSIVDRMYIGNIAGTGEIALAGVGICGPIVTLISSVAFLVGVGGSPLMSIRLGEKNERAARQILANCFLLLTVLSVVITVISLLVKNHLIMWFGASEATFPYANAYITIYLLGTVFALLATG